MCEEHSDIDIEAPLEVFARLIELLEEGVALDSAMVLELLKIVRRHARE